MVKPKLFILDMPMKEGPGKLWMCSNSTLLEGALLINSHWNELLEVCRIDYRKRQAEMKSHLGEKYQGLPVLMLESGKLIKNSHEIIDYLAKRFGGALVYR